MAASTVHVTAEAFRNSLEALTATIDAAITQYEAEPTSYFEYGYGQWKNRALRLLSDDLGRVKMCLSDVSNSANAKQLVTLGSNELGLAKKLDTFNFDFAGPIFDKRLNDGVDAVVGAASALLHAIASGG